jgi:hypothetical protein
VSKRCRIISNNIIAVTTAPIWFYTFHWRRRGGTPITSNQLYDGSVTVGRKLSSLLIILTIFIELSFLVSLSCWMTFFLRNTFLINSKLVDRFLETRRAYFRHYSQSACTEHFMQGYSRIFINFFGDIFHSSFSWQLLRCCARVSETFVTSFRNRQQVQYWL